MLIDPAKLVYMTPWLRLQATVGLLVAKTLTNATANPFLSSGSGAYNPVLALDVFLVQVGSCRGMCKRDIARTSASLCCLQVQRVSGRHACLAPEQH